MLRDKRTVGLRFWLVKGKCLEDVKKNIVLFNGFCSQTWFVGSLGLACTTG